VSLLDGELVRYLLPERRDGQTVPEVLDLLEEAGLARGAVSPDHWVHVSPGGGGGNACPAVEPMETGLKEPWPPEAPQRKKSCEVSVVVVDTGWHPPAATDPRTPWTHDIEGDDELNGPDLRPYAGHGTFVAGVVRCLAPGTDIEVEGIMPHGGACYESDIARELNEALSDPERPQLISISAGTYTRRNLGLLTGAAQIAMTGNGSLGVTAPFGGGFFGLGASASHSGDGWSGSASGNALGPLIISAVSLFAPLAVASLVMGAITWAGSGWLIKWVPKFAPVPAGAPVRDAPSDRPVRDATPDRKEP
jgi:hypothetical protein